MALGLPTSGTRAVGMAAATLSDSPHYRRFLFTCWFATKWHGCPALSGSRIGVSAWLKGLEHAVYTHPACFHVCDAPQ